MRETNNASAWGSGVPPVAYSLFSHLALALAAIGVFVIPEETYNTRIVMQITRAQRACSDARSRRGDNKFPARTRKQKSLLK